MCGFVGIIANQSNANTYINDMVNAIDHRGPDDKGIWVNDQNTLALAHARLAIIDLSQAGHQPMLSHCKKFTIVFNGEIYNHNDLRNDILSENPTHNWRGHSDTETLLTGFSYWGVEETLRKAIGMFGFALLDQEKQTLILGRDRLGEKPVYYGWNNENFFFGSELKSFCVHPDFEKNVDRNSLCLFLRHNYIPAPYSIFKDIYKLNPGHILRLDLTTKKQDVKCYWSAKSILEQKKSSFNSSESVTDELEKTLKAAVKRQMEADVPLGAFLSGGIDSSTIVALMQSQSEEPVNTFSIGFYEEGFNEAEHAKAIAEHLNTNHTELYVKPEKAMEIIPKIAKLYDEPFADSSQIPTFLVSEMAKQHVTVSLSGDAGDELFCGYNRYILTDRVWKKLKLIPTPIRHMIAKVILSISPETLDKALNPLKKVVPQLRLAFLGDKLHKAANILASKSLNELYKGMVSQWRHPEDVVIDSKEHSTILKDETAFNALGDIEKMMALDTMTYLPDDILAKVDRAAMGVSLETRVPMLDHTVVEFAWRLPIEYKLEAGISKSPLRNVLYRHVPKELIERPKMGFGIPLAEWLRGPLKDWADELLSEERLNQEGFFDSNIIRATWDEHCSGKRNWSGQLWCILVFQMWQDEYLKS